MRRWFTILMLALAVMAMAQERKVTPVESDDEKPQQPQLHYYDKHGNSLKEPVLFLAELDTVQKVYSGPVYPLLHAVNVGVNIFDPVMNIFGQKHTSLDVWGNISLFNWILPTIETGIGWGNNHPDGLNYRYVAKPAWYLKLGFDYNFLYKSNPDYKFLAGFRAGFSTFTYDIKDITISSGYWQDHNTINLMGQKSSAFYGQALIGVQVKIWKQISMGWTARYNFKFKVNNGKNAKPWFIPGLGTGGAMSATFSVIYTIPLSKQPVKEIDESNQRTLQN